MEKLSIDSNDLIPTQEDMEIINDEIDGIELSDSDTILWKDLDQTKDHHTIKIKGN